MSWVLPSLAALLLIVVTCYIQSPVWAENDDFTFASILSEGLPEGAFTVFVNICLSVPIAALYSIASTVPWWALFQLAIIGVCNVALCQAVLKKLKEKPALKWSSLALIQAVCVGCMVQNLQFTLTSGLACGTGIFFMCGVRSSRYERIFGTILVLLGALLRPEMILVLTGMLGCVTLVKVATQWFKNCKDKETRKHVALLGAINSNELRLFVLHALVVIGALAVLTAVHAGVYSAAGLNDYLAFNDARSAYMDYPHAQYGDYPQVFSELGWDKDLAILTNNFYCMDDAITTQSLTKIASLPVPKNFDLPGAVNCFTVVVVMFIAFMVSFFHARNGAQRFSVVATGFVYYALSAVLVVTGRFPSRVVIGVSLIFFGMAMSFVESKDACEKPKNKSRGGLSAILCWALVISLVANSAVYLLQTWSPKTIADKAKSAQISLDAYADAASHPNDVFIEDISVITTRLYALNVTDYEAKNLVFWGGWEYGSPHLEQKLSSLGLSQDRSCALLHENCYLYTVSPTNESPLSNLLARMCTLSGSKVEATQVRSYPSGLTVYKLHTS